MCYNNVTVYVRRSEKYVEVSKKKRKEVFFPLALLHLYK
jgi:hypothetical protein